MRTRSRPLLGAALTAFTIVFVRPAAGQSFVNWETPHVHPLEQTPDGTKLLAVNTPDNRLEIFSINASGLTRLGSITTGLDPVSVRARTNTEAWVVNHVSDSISIVDLATFRVAATISTGDEPCDVVFAGTPQRAFVTVSQLNQVRIYDPQNLTSPPAIIAIEGEDPRALATDGSRVFVAVFDSGNRTTVLSKDVVASAISPYPGQPCPPPNDGANFNPPIAAELPPPPQTALIVKKSADNTWRDDNGADWSAAVTWDLHDHDIAVIDVATLAVSYASGLMNHNMAIALHPLGNLTVVGTDALNHIRFEPILRGRFLRVQMSSLNPLIPETVTTVDLNPHLDYQSGTVSQSVRDESLGDPRAIVWNSAGDVGYVAGMGSNNIIAIDAAGGRLGRVDVAEGPTGLSLDEVNGRLYVMNKFDGSITTIATVSLTEVASTSFYDPTPATIRIGRPHLYDTHRSSGLGHTACGSCHIDGRMDQLAWDLGDPSGQMKTFNQECTFGGGGCEDWHPMKGPLVTQTLVGIIGDEPLHWRGDRESLAAFDPAFISLLGDDALLTPEEMAEFSAFVATIRQPPNPFRNFNGSLPTAFGNGGNAVAGVQVFNNDPVFAGTTTCATCHLLPSGTTHEIIPRALLANESQSIKVPQLENLHEKTGFNRNSMNNNRGFGFTHDGTVDTIVRFLESPVFQFAAGAAGVQQRLDMEAYMLTFSFETHPAIGRQTTLIDANNPGFGQLQFISNMISQGNFGNAGLMVKGRINGISRGFRLNAGQGTFQSDRAAQVLTTAQLQALAAPGSELTYTLVPPGSQTRIGIDRDEDGYFDRDELDVCSDPSDPTSTPANSTPLAGDLNGNLVVDLEDLGILLSNFGTPSGATPAQGDLNGDGAVELSDLALLLGSYGRRCPV
jgi:YVTN family beta-propeller protein